MNGKSTLDLADAIDDLRDQLEAARSRAVNSGIQFPIQSVTVELQIIAATGGEGKIGFKVPVIDLELGGSGRHSREATHRISIELGGPVTSDGRPIRVDRVSDIPLD